MNCVIHQSHGAYLPRASPCSVAQRGDETGLLKILDSQELTDEIRHGAIDGLASMATQTAIDALAKLGKDEDEDEDLRKAAWRARRRAIRSQQSEVSA